MRTSTLAYINLALLAIFALVYSTYNEPAAGSDGRVHTVYITAAASGSIEAATIASACDAVEKDWNGVVTLIFAENDPASIARALKRATGMRPDGISLPGAQDDVLLLPFVIEAERQGIPVTFHSVPFPSAQQRFEGAGAGFVGERGDHSGRSLTRLAVDRFAVTPKASVLVVTAGAEVVPGSRLSGCLDYLREKGVEPELLTLAPPADAMVDAVADPGLTRRLHQPPLPKVIFWDAGPVAQLAGLLEVIGADYNTVSVVSLTPQGVPLEDTELQFVKLKAVEQPFLTCYYSLVQLHLTHRYGMPGLEIPMGGL